MKKISCILLIFGCFMAYGQSVIREPDYSKPVVLIAPLAEQRINEIALLLPDKPRGLGAPCDNRKDWDHLRSGGRYSRVIREADALLSKKFPEWDDPTYMRMFTHGDSQSGKDLLSARLRWLVVLAWAECLENTGKYIPKLEEVITGLLNQKTWVNPRNYNEKNYAGLVELSAASYAHNLAQVYYLLYDKLKPSTRAHIVTSLYQRVFNPVLATLQGKNRDHGWLLSTNNWNAVCLSGITGAALTVLPDRTERARFVAMAEKYHQNFIAGFLSDGYCTEGIGYYNYGFGRFITLRENIWQATGGRIDLFDTPKIRKIAAFGPNSEIINGTYPAIADCRANTSPAGSILKYVSRNLGMGLTAYDTLSLEGQTADLVASVLHVFPNMATEKTAATEKMLESAGIRSYFDAAGILTVRPAKGAVSRLGAVFKGGKNNEHHNHNDLGSYTIAVGKEILMGDPGLIPYTAKTFGPERYSYKTLASYGHPVPLVAGTQQRAGAEANAGILKTGFTDERDVMLMDLSSAYAVEGLVRLHREFVYSRSGVGSLQVTDAFEFDAPRGFETALVTRGQWKRVSDYQLVLYKGEEVLSVTAESSTGAFVMEAETISEEGGEPYTRIAFRLSRPAKKGVFTVTYAEAGTVPLLPVDERRVTEIAGLLSGRPAGLGDPCSRRDTWDRLLKSGRYDRFLEEMTHFSFPPFSKEDYFSLSDGTAPSSARGLNMMRNRAKGLSQVTWAECLENKGRYAKAVEAGLRDIIDQKSWVSPRVDYGFINYKGIEYTVDLTSALYAHTIAQTLYMMGDKLSPGIRKEALQALYKRVFNPLLRNFETLETGHHGWLTGTNNWNAVCLSGVVGAALTVIEDKYERARFAWIGALYSRNTLAGFGEDGYCSEGMGYYNYGFEHYMLLRENILKATSGSIDLFDHPKVKKIALYPVRIEVINDVYPAISDSRIGAGPDKGLMSYLSRSLGLGLTGYESLTFEGATSNIRKDIVLVFPPTIPLEGVKPVSKEMETHLRSFFKESVVLVARPGSDSSGKMGVAMKGGNNAEHHNHNDVGSYTIVLGDEIIAGDPGVIPYTADIFQKEHRYTYKTIASYGHPVPLTAGVQQCPGEEAKDIILETDFTEEKDVFSMDISSAYAVPDLRKLTRTFIYDRKGRGRLAVSDFFTFARPYDFETALITRAAWKQLPSGQLLLEGKDGRLLVTIDCPGNDFRLRSEEISEGGTPYTRIAVSLAKPAASGRIQVVYEPAGSSLPELISMNKKDLIDLRSSLRAGDARLKAPYRKLLATADKWMKVPAEKVTDGDLPPSGDRHDFFAIGKLSWPNPASADGMPYVRRDGITNPEADGDRYDLGRYSETLSRVNTLALAWFYSGEEKYAAKATELLRVWFLDPATRMNPNMKNASALPGVYDGMPIGIIFSVALIKLVDYVRLLETSESWTSGDSSLLKKWFADYTGWLLESEFGKKEREALNNHGTWYSAQVAAFSMYSGNPERIVPAVEETKERIRRQVADDGSLPAELKRQRSLHYAIYGLQAFAYVARCAAFTGGPDLWHYKTADGRGLELAFGFLAPYLLQEKEWTWTNIEAGKPAAPAARQLMLWAAKAYDDPVLDRTARYLLQAVPEDSETRLTVRLPD